MTFSAMGRSGALPSVTRAITGTERAFAPETVSCAHCGEVIDFTRRDPAGLGRSMQGCRNPKCIDHRSRPMTLRHVGPTDSVGPS